MNIGVASCVYLSPMQSYIFVSACGGGSSTIAIAGSVLLVAVIVGALVGGAFTYRKFK